MERRSKFISMTEPAKKSLNLAISLWPLSFARACNVVVHVEHESLEGFPLTSEETAEIIREEMEKIGSVS